MPTAASDVTVTCAMVRNRTGSGPRTETGAAAAHAAEAHAAEARAAEAHAAAAHAAEAHAAEALADEPSQMDSTSRGLELVLALSPAGSSHSGLFKPALNFVEVKYLKYLE